jgi:hypothetical protein
MKAITHPTEPELLTLASMFFGEHNRFEMNETVRQTKPKSIQDLTPFELSQINDFQNRNRGFEDYDEEDLENYWED